MKKSKHLVELLHKNNIKFDPPNFEQEIQQTTRKKSSAPFVDKSKLPPVRHFDKLHSSTKSGDGENGTLSLKYVT